MVLERDCLQRMERLALPRGLYYPFVWQPSSTPARLFPPVICFVQLAWLFVTFRDGMN